MTEHFIAFKNFPTRIQAKELEILLDRNNIKSVLADNIAPVDITFSGSTLQNQYEIKIDPADFAKAEAILEKDTENILNEVDKDHYLLSFSDEELYDVLLKSDEWNVFDYKLAQKLLIERGKNIDSEVLASLKKERLQILAKPEEPQKSWITVGYIFSLLGGFLGIIIGYLLWTSKKTLPNGERIYSYNEDDRKHGKTIFILGTIIFPLALLIKILTTN
ncbi:hypothetical protein SAMN06265349_104214 [Flavobacterium resistens]|uniref:DUF2007 domain-containing protein n=1 Tax=Flavobacterium resistens TaxID=443612 RepID=A0A521E7V3_9FLAO|nr:hypothetical protein [Flavobacterium resistens]MRX69101.1 hypothetical protein [Flavobacterium resistens]SMO80026.1 hypothetical protein SAMN06265349_104214 [Flavobacterium resistens]